MSASFHLPDRVLFYGAAASQPRLQETAFGRADARSSRISARGIEKNQNARNRAVKIAGRLPAKSFSVVEQRWLNIEKEEECVSARGKRE